jgi:hypothetical protein
MRSGTVDFTTLDGVKAMGDDAAKVVRWGTRLESALHLIAEHSDDMTLQQVREFALRAILDDEDLQNSPTET